MLVGGFLLETCKCRLYPGYSRTSRTNHHGGQEKIFWSVSLLFDSKRVYCTRILEIRDKLVRIVAFRVSSAFFVARGEIGPERNKVECRPEGQYNAQKNHSTTYLSNFFMEKIGIVGLVYSAMQPAFPLSMFLLEKYDNINLFCRAISEIRSVAVQAVHSITFNCLSTCSKCTYSSELNNKPDTFL